MAILVLSHGAYPVLFHTNLQRKCLMYRDPSDLISICFKYLFQPAFNSVSTSTKFKLLMILNSSLLLLLVLWISEDTGISQEATSQLAGKPLASLPGSL